MGGDTPLPSARKEKARASRLTRTTEAFEYKALRIDRGTPSYEYNSMEHLAVHVKKPGAGSPVFLSPSWSRSPGFSPITNVRMFPTSTTRDDRAKDAAELIQERAARIRKKGRKKVREGKILEVDHCQPARVRPPTNMRNTPTCNQGKEELKKKKKYCRRRSGRSRRRENERMHIYISLSLFLSFISLPPSLQGSPREGSPAPQKRHLGRRPATGRQGMFKGVLMPADAFPMPFAGGSDRDLLPGRLEAVVFPERYMDWPEEKAHTLAKGVEESPVCYSLGFQSAQARIVFNQPSVETKGWDGPGAYDNIGPGAG
ncbi:unnamed protein product, partial [Discosporangium mesarthrocarpum]